MWITVKTIIRLSVKYRKHLIKPYTVSPHNRASLTIALDQFFAKLKFLGWLGKYQAVSKQNRGFCFSEHLWNVCGIKIVLGPRTGENFQARKTTLEFLRAESENSWVPGEMPRWNMHVPSRLVVAGGVITISRAIVLGEQTESLLPAYTSAPLSGCWVRE